MAKEIDHRYDLPLGLVGGNLSNKGLDRLLKEIDEPYEKEFDPFGDPDGNPIPGFNIQG